MAIQFPADPAAQSPLNTFSPNSLPEANSTNDFIYTWESAGSSGYWTCQGGSAGGGGNGTTRGGGADLVFQENQMTCNADYSISADWSALSAGPITIEDGATITVPDSQSWVIL